MFPASDEVQLVTKKTVTLIKNKVNREREKRKPAKNQPVIPVRSARGRVVCAASGEGQIGICEIGRRASGTLGHQGTSLECTLSAPERFPARSEDTTNAAVYLIREFQSI